MSKNVTARWITLITCTILVATTSSLLAQPQLVSTESERPKIGLVLGGGGAKGLAHVGVIKVLEEQRIPIDYIAGTSMGAIVGGLYAAGMSSDELEGLIENINWTEVFKDKPPRKDRTFRDKEDDYTYLLDFETGVRGGKFRLPEGFIQGQQIYMELKKLTHAVRDVSDFDQLSIPFRAVAVDAGTGQQVVLEQGSLPEAIRASMSLPGVFAPAYIDGRLLVDGGILNNVPIDVARDMGADIVIVVDVGSPISDLGDSSSAISIMSQSSAILSRTRTEAQLATLASTDVLLVPDISEVGALDFNDLHKIVALGETVAQQRRSELTRLSISPEKYQQYLKQRAALVPQQKPPVIEFIRIETNSKLDTRTIRARLRITEGDVLDEQLLREDINQIYALKNFQQVDYKVIEENGKIGLVIIAEAKSWGPNYLRFGLNLISDFDEINKFNLASRLDKTEINGKGGEWRNILQLGDTGLIFSELYQPLDFGSRYFVAPRIRYRSSNFSLYEDGDRIADFKVVDYAVGFDIGRELSTWGEIRLGIERGVIDLERRVGLEDLELIDPDLFAALDEAKLDEGAFFAALRYDKLDNARFPRQGAAFVIEWLGARTDLGAEAKNDAFFASSYAANSWGKHTVGFGVEFGTNSDNRVQDVTAFVLGGPLRLSGLKPDELIGRNSALLQLVYQNRFSGGVGILGMPVYLGASLEKGNIWSDRSDISFDSAITAGSVFMGLDTAAGSIFVSAGFAEDNRSSFYFSFGMPLRPIFLVGRGVR